MKINRSGLVIEVERGADPALAAKVLQFLANSINADVIGLCTFGEVVASPGHTLTAANFISAAKMPDEREPAPSAIEAMPVEEPPVAPKTTPARKK